VIGNLSGPTVTLIFWMVYESMIEIVGNLHLHTNASDGVGTHHSVAAAAAQAGLDFIIYTDHNIWVDDVEGWFQFPEFNREVLCLMGQEMNDPYLVPEANHLLCHFVCEDLNGISADPQALINRVIEREGLCFLAHPLERPGLREAKHIFPWINWEVSGYTGIELWNAMTDAKWQLRTLSRGFIGAYLAYGVLSAPFPEVLAKWDALLATGQKVVAIGNSDAHGMSFTLGPFTRTIYPYEFLFRCVNTHLLLETPLQRDVAQARQQIRESLKAGHCFVSYDLVGDSKGFVFVGQSEGDQATMGDTLTLHHSATLQIFSPQSALLRLLKDGQVIAQTDGQILNWQADRPGVYRVEAYRRFWGRQRGWVFTNPIYVRG
jgi:hypothetical protein